MSYRRLKQTGGGPSLILPRLGLAGASRIARSYKSQRALSNRIVSNDREENVHAAF